VVRTFRKRAFNESGGRKQIRTAAGSRRMARFAIGSSGMIVAFALLFATARTPAQAPCTDEQARQKQGSLQPDTHEQSALNARSRVMPDPVVLKKIAQTIALLKQALPDFKGVEGHYWHEIFDPSPSSHTFRYEVTAAFLDLYCVPAKNQRPDVAGKVRLADETGTWIYFSFNSLGWLVNERVSLGKELRTTNGETIFLLPKENGEWKGHRLFLPLFNGQEAEAIILTAPNHFPFKPVSREDFLQAREKVAQGYLNEARAKVGLNSPAAKEREGQLEWITKLHAAMTPAELQSQAVVRDWNAMPPRGKLFVSEAEGGLRLVTVDHAYIDPTLTRSAVQLITVYWRWDDNPAKSEVIRQFKNNFDFAALQGMLDR
jgi:hypothetical protein